MTSGATTTAFVLAFSRAARKVCALWGEKPLPENVRSYGPSSPAGGGWSVVSSPQPAIANAAPTARVIHSFLLMKRLLRGCVQRSGRSAGQDPVENGLPVFARKRLPFKR